MRIELIIVRGQNDNTMGVVEGTMGVVEGIVIGIAGSAVFALLTWVAKTRVVPAIQALLYHGPDISGKWSTYDSLEDGAEPVGHAEITQSGHRLSMVNTRSRSRSGKPKIRKFSYAGTFHAGQLTLLFEDQAAKGYITGAIVMKLSSDAEQLEGKATYLDHNDNIIVSHNFYMRRQ